MRKRLLFSFFGLALSACGVAELPSTATATLAPPSVTFTITAVAPTLTVTPLPTTSTPTVAATTTPSSTPITPSPTPPSPTPTLPSPTPVTPSPTPAAPIPTLVVTWPVVRLAIETDPQVSFSDIAILNSDGSGFTQLTTYGFNADPVLSPDGQRIAYRSIPASITALADPGARLYEGLYNIWVINADGSGAQKLTDSELVRSIPTWSADSTKILFSEGPAGTVVEIDLATGARRVWLTGGWQPRYHPAGDGLGYLTANGSLAWRATAGTTQVLVDATTLPTRTTVHDFTWIPGQNDLYYSLADERERVFQSSLGIRYSLWLHPVEAAPVLLTEDVHDVQISPNGQVVSGYLGSGYGDACRVDWKLALVAVASNPPWPYRLVGEFAGRPPAEDFYPTSTVYWLTDEWAVAHFSVTCAPEGAGWYVIDIANRRLLLLRATVVR